MYKAQILKNKEEYLQATEYDPDFAYRIRFYLNETAQEVNGENDGIRISSLIDKNFFEQLAEAYAKDIMNITEENYYRSSAKNYYVLSTRYFISSEYRIPESFNNTLELLEYFGFDIFKKEQLSDRELSEYFEGGISNRRIRIYTASEWREMNCVPQGIPLHGRYSVSIGRDKNNVKKIDIDLCDLYRAAEPMNIVPDNGYIIYVFDRAWAIPEELNGTAARVYAGISEDGSVEYDENGNPFWLESTDEKVLQEVPIYTGTAATETND